MAGKSDYLEGVALKVVIGAGLAIAITPYVYVALYSVAPTDAGGGTELSGGGYVRLQSDSAAWPWSGNKKSNGQALTFPVATANWLPVVAVGLFDAASGGNLLFWTLLSPTTTIAYGARFSIPVNGFQLTEV